jgi:hypothetical protein
MGEVMWMVSWVLRRWRWGEGEKGQRQPKWSVVHRAGVKREETALGYHANLLGCVWEGTEGEGPAGVLVRMRQTGCLAGRCRGQRVGARPLEAARLLLEDAGMLLSYRKNFLELHCWCWGPWRTASSAESPLTSPAAGAWRGEGQERRRMSRQRTITDSSLSASI